MEASAKFPKYKVPQRKKRLPPSENTDGSPPRFIPSQSNKARAAVARDKAQGTGLSRGGRVGEGVVVVRASSAKSFS